MTPTHPRSRSRWWLGVLVLLALAAPEEASAHRFTPGVARVSGGPAGTWQVGWRAPEPLQSGLRLVVDEGCAVRASTASSWHLDCGSEGPGFTVAGLSGSSAEVLVVAPDETVTVLRGREDSWRLAPTSPLPERAAVFWRLAPTSPAPERGAVFADYGALGVEHILRGPDHLAFVFGLLLLITGWRRLLVTLTAFTVAHSVTLAGAVLGAVTLPSAPVEAAIALSIVFVAREAARTQAAPWRTVALAAAGFGLLHGFGFAGALTELGLPEGQVPAALVAFNVGVELGQVFVVAVALAAVAVLRAVWTQGPGQLRPLATYGLGVAAAFWTLERVAHVGGWA